MSLKNINAKRQSERGFTIVELLIVIVIIAILAAITIVSYSGITAQANSSSAQSTAANVMKKLEAWNATKGTYPTSYGSLKASSEVNEPYYIPSSINITGTAIGSAPSDPNTVNIYRCDSGKGAQVRYWKYDGTPALQTITTGSQASCSLLTS